jgi:hypothetical protein
MWPAGFLARADAETEPSSAVIASGQRQTTICRKNRPLEHVTVFSAVAPVVSVTSAVTASPGSTTPPRVKNLNRVKFCVGTSTKCSVRCGPV